ncbi:MAG TPA: LemA family protein [Polyangia bacterium]|jgi:LemA protein|nr:LemA family protein [Polyangia bacterium]
MFRSGKSVLVVILALIVVIVGFGASSYNHLVRLDQAVKAQWSQVENVYQRRADLVPNLVETVKGAAKFEKDTLTAVTEARARVGQLPAGGPPADPAALAKFQQAQDQLSSSLSRLLVVAEQYPELKATANFRDLQVQLEGAENRITVERMRFGEVAQAFNSTRDTFPTAIVAGLFGGRFAEKAYFTANAGAATAPRVQF